MIENCHKAITTFNIENTNEKVNLYKFKLRMLPSFEELMTGVKQTGLVLLDVIEVLMILEGSFTSSTI